MKKVFVLVLALVVVMSASVAMAAPVTLVYAEVNPLDTIVGQIAQAFKTKVEELSGGEVKIDLQAGGVLGTEAQLLDGMLGGGDTVDMMRISAFALTSYGCQKAMLLSVPYTFVSREHFWKFANSPMAAEFLSEPHDIGLPLRGLAYGEEGFRHFFFKDAVAGINDLKGKKIRSMPSSTSMAMIEAMGGSPVPMSAGETYTSLQQGIVDGAENTELVLNVNNSLL